MENVGREMSRVKSLVTPPLGSATKIPQVRSTPLKKVSDIREKLERERTFTVESTPESSPKLKQSPQKSGRRQWTNFGRAAKSDDEDEDVFRDGFINP